MPKKPLSMYMLYYSEKREQILAENTSLSMPEVAKICSEQYQVKLSCLNISILGSYGYLKLGHFSK
jgi:hypothetical protein